jgi:WD40 repeat protein
MSYENGDMQILFGIQTTSRVRFGSNPLEMYKVELRVHGYSVESAAFSPDGRRILTASDDASSTGSCSREDPLGQACHIKTRSIKQGIMQELLVGRI